ncbi:MAG TPA: peptidoglycan binding domain-containing protein, partial [Acidimicrobiales bacterium]|nr:peptidoglycan binding domain-containing protein [Acidimicrobiales bacterium]
MLVLGAAIGFALLLSVVAFAADQAAHAGKVSRNVSVGGRNVSSASKAELADILQEVARRYATTEVLVADKDDTGFTTDAGSIGVRVDPAATAERTLAVGRSGSLPGRWWSWLGSFGATRRSELALSVDQGAVDRLVAEKGAKGGDPPVDAGIQLDNKGKLVGVAGKAGRGIDAGLLADDLREAANRGTPISLKARRGGLAPRFDKADADALAERAEALVAKPLPLAAEGTTSSLSSNTLRSLLSSTPGPTELELRVDEAAAAAAAEKALSKAGIQPVEPTFRIEVDKAITLVPGAAGRPCCGPEAGKKVASAILQRPDGPVPLTVTDKQPKLSN